MQNNLQFKKCQSKRYPEYSCKLIKPIDLFRKSRSLCKECEKIYKNKWYKNNIENVKNRTRQYIAAHKCETKEYQKQYRINNKDSIKECQKKYYQENRAEFIEYIKQYYKENKEKRIEYSEKYRREHKIIRNNNAKIRRKNDPIFRLRTGLSRDIGRAIKNNGSSKKGKSIIKYLTYTIQELKDHLEKQFKLWMTWDNQGKYDSKTWNDNDQTTWKWNIDHIIPHSTFKYTSMEDQSFKDCWALENLRPYSAKQNQLDGATKIRHHL